MPIRSISLLALAIALATGAHAADRLPVAGADDLVPQRLIAAPDPGFATERQPVAFAWAIDRGTVIEAQTPFVAESREYWETVDADTLRAGYLIDTTAPGAVVRISPATDAQALDLRPDQLTVEHLGVGLAGEKAVDQVVTAEQLRQLGADFSDGTLGFRIRPEHGAGTVSLRAAKAKGRYLIHVFEPNSPYALLLGSDRDAHLAGEKLALSGRLLDGQATVAIERMSGVLTAPDGRTWPVEFGTAGNGDTVARLDLPSDASAQPGLWEVHGFAVAHHPGGRLLRDVKVAVAVAAPTARLLGDYRHEFGDGLKVSFDVEAASAGRYEVGAVLYGTDTDGRLKPMAVGRSADWLEPGQGSLSLDFGADLLGRGFSPPYALREVSLNDQSRMGRLESRAIGPQGLAPLQAIDTPIQRPDVHVR